MITYDRINDALNQAVKETLKDFFDAERATYQKHRANDRKAKAKRKRTDINDLSWTEEYPLVIERVSQFRRENAVVAVRGADVRYDITERFHPSDSVPRNWELYVVSEVEGTPSTWVDASEDFESLIQRAVVMAICSAYYGV
jgi:hypothetical protein